MIPLLAELLDVPTIIGGHGYGLRDSSLEEREDDGVAGIGTTTIVAVLVLAVVTVGLLVGLSPSSTRAKVRRAAPIGFTAAIIAMPLVVWTASSGGEEEQLVVERATNEITGAPEFIVSLLEEDLNTLETTDGKRAVRVECLGREGQMVLDAKQTWPFKTEAGYEYPHVHQAASREQVQRADRCRLRGTGVRLEADVEGALTG